MIHARFSRQVKDPEQFLNKDSEDTTGDQSKESRIVTPSRYCKPRALDCNYVSHSRTILPPHTPHFIYFNPADSLDSLSSLQSGHRISPSPVRLTEAEGNAASTPGSCLTDPEVNIRQANRISSDGYSRFKFVSSMSPLTPRPWWTQS